MTVPFCTGSPYRAKYSLAWYSCSFIALPLDQRDVLADALDRFVERGPLDALERDLVDPLHAAGPEDRRHADVQILDPILAGQICRQRDHALAVLQDRLDHLADRRPRREERAAGLE